MCVGVGVCVWVVACARVCLRGWVCVGGWMGVWACVSYGGTPVQPPTNPFSCDVNNVPNAVSGATYTDCDGKSTGQTCTPQCLPGYGISTSASTLTLACDASGDFDGSNALVCVECITGMASDGNSACTPCNAPRPTKSGISPKQPTQRNTNASLSTNSNQAK